VSTQLGDGADWWAELLQSVIYAHLDSQLVERVKEDLMDNVDVDRINMAHKFVFHGSLYSCYLLYTVSQNNCGNLF